MGHIPQIDGLRAVAILMVFTTHALHIPLLWMGVDLFFVLSGYLITGILLRLKERRGTGELLEAVLIFGACGEFFPLTWDS